MKKQLLFLLLFIIGLNAQAQTAAQQAETAVRATVSSKIPNRGLRPSGYSAADVRDAMNAIITHANRKMDSTAMSSYAKISQLNNYATLAALNNYVSASALSNYVPVSELANYATKNDLNNKVTIVTGKGLSTNDYTSPEKTKLSNLPTAFKTIAGSDIAGVGNLTLPTKADTSALNTVANSRTPVTTSTALRAGSVGFPSAVILTDKQGYTFRYEATNTMLDDSAMVIRQGGRRYVRVTDVLMPEFWNAVGNGTTDDTQAWKKLLLYYSTAGKAKKIVAQNQYLISETLHHNNNLVRGVGLIIEGSNREKSGFYTYNINGPLFQIDGNDDNTANNTTYRNAYGLNLSNFFIRKAPTSTTGTVSGIEFSSQKDFTFRDLYIFGMGADGIKLTSIGFTDFGESSNGLFQRVWVEGCPGAGFKLQGSPTSTFTAGYITFDHISSFYNGTGVYLEMADQITIHDSQIVGNTTYGIHVKQKTEMTARHIFIYRNELGNSNLLSSIRIESVVRAHIYENRFVLNPTETTAKQVELGTSDGSGVAQKVLIENNYIIQSRADTPGHYQYFIHTSNGDFHDITIRDDYYIEFQSGTKYNDISRINVLRERTGNGTPVQDRRGVKGVVFPTTDATSYTPNPVYNYRHQFTASATLTINNPIGPAQEGQKFSYAIQSGSASQIVVSVYLGNEYIASGPITFILPAYKGDFLSFEYVAGYWRVLGSKTPTPLTEVILTNPASLTPKKGEIYRLTYNAGTSTTISNPTGAFEPGDEIPIGVWNTNSSTVTATWGNAFIGNITVPTGVTDAKVLVFRYLTGYWIQVK